MKITTTAAKHLADGLAHASASQGPGVCFRMVPSTTEGRFRLALGRPTVDDETFEVEGTVVLAIAPEIATQCENKVLDLREQPDGTTQLAFG